MLTLINNLNFAVFIFFTVIYSYRIIYVLVGLLSKRKEKQPASPVKLHRYAVIIAARNEQAVIGELIKSILNQNYPRELIDIFVIADNCIDNTAQIAKEAGAIVYERYNRTLVGKGYALDYMFKIIEKEYSVKEYKEYEGYFIFDADNILDENFISEMNRLFDKGYRVLTSYRNSKNYYQNWITAGYGLWFLHESKYINNPRMILGKSCAISGTGFLVHGDIIKKNGGWKHHLLTEDIEFSVSQVIKGEVIGYCGSAVLYDEQPAAFIQSWNQRLRWSKGFYQVFAKYGSSLLSGSFAMKKHSFSCYDMMLTVMPAVLVSIMIAFFNGFFLISGLLSPEFDYKVVYATFSAIKSSVLIYYSILFSFALITTITEWNNIYCPKGKKILYIFTFPFFMFTYIPIAIVALFKKVGWKPIAHTCAKSLQDIRKLPT